MKLPTVLQAALAAIALTAIAGSAANAAPADREHTTRAVRSPNGKDLFVRIVKIPKMQTTADKRCCPMDPAHCAQRTSDKSKAQG